MSGSLAVYRWWPPKVFLGAHNPRTAHKKIFFKIWYSAPLKGTSLGPKSSQERKLCKNIQNDSDITLFLLWISYSVTLCPSPYHYHLMLKLPNVQKREDLSCLSYIHDITATETASVSFYPASFIIISSRLSAGVPFSLTGSFFLVSSVLLVGFNGQGLQWHSSRFKRTRPSMAF